MIEPFYNLKKYGKKQGKTRNFVLKTRVFGEKGGLLKRTVFLKTRVFDEKDDVFENPGF